MNVYECIRMYMNVHVIILMQTVVSGWKKKSTTAQICTHTQQSAPLAQVMCALYFHRCVHGGADCCVFVHNSPPPCGCSTRA